MCPQLLHHLRCILMFFLFLFCLLKVKIWFQNKRSKYKKIMKHGSSGPEGDMLHTTSSSSPCSPGLSQLWEVSMANKVPPMHPSSYMNNYGHWYPPHHQDPLPRPQMMWLKAEKQSQRDSIPYWHLLTCDGAFLYNVHHVFYCLVCLKGLCFTLYASRLHVLHLSSFLTFSDLLQCAWNKEFMKE